MVCRTERVHTSSISCWRVILSVTGASVGGIVDVEAPVLGAIVGGIDVYADFGMEMRNMEADQLVPQHWRDGHH